MKELTARYLPGSPPYPIREDSSLVQPLVDGAEYFGAIRQEIGRAKAGDAIYLLGWRFDAKFRFNNDPVDPSTLVGVLAEKAAQGVDVRLIMSAKWQLLALLESKSEEEVIADANNSFELKNQLDRFGPNGNPANAKALREFKVGSNMPLRGRVLEDHSGELFGIHHQKIVVVVRSESIVGFLGGIDFMPDRLDTRRHDLPLPRRTLGTTSTTAEYYWHDIGAQVEGLAAKDLLNIFLTRWAYCLQLPARRFQLKNGQQIELNPQLDMNSLVDKTKTNILIDAHKTGVQVVINMPEHDVRGANPVAHEDHGLFSNRHRVHGTYDLYAKAIKAARNYIYVEDQYFNSRRLESAIREAAQRKVRIVVVIGGWDDDGSAEVALKMTSPFLHSLGDTVAVYHLQRSVVHSKLMIIDDEFFSIGSANFSDRSLSEYEDEGGTEPLRLFLRGIKQAWATDSETVVGVVDGRPGEINTARRLRVSLWAEHLRVNEWDPTLRPVLFDAKKSLPLLNPNWGRVPFPVSESRLQRVTIEP